jgi:hypothetical protein
MKRLFLFILLLAAARSAPAQEAPAVKPVDNTDEEAFALLDMLGARGFRFDLSAFTAAGEYAFAPYLEEYAAGEEQEDSGIRFGAQPNWRPVFPDDAFDSPGEREEWLADKTLSADGKKYLTFESIGLFIVPRNDSTSRMGFSFYGAMSGGFPPLKLRPLDNRDPAEYMYDVRPFKISPTAEKRQRVPLLLYGSFWWDEKYGVHRFCGESEFEPDLSNETLKQVPHYYVIGVEVEKK